MQLSIKISRFRIYFFWVKLKRIVSAKLDHQLISNLPDVPVGGANFRTERAFEFDFFVDAHLMPHQIAFGEVAFTANVAPVVTNVTMHQVHVILKYVTEGKVLSEHIGNTETGTQHCILRQVQR